MKNFFPQVWVFAALILARSLEAASSSIRNHFNPASVHQLSSTDAVILVDFWQSRACVEMSERFDDLVDRANGFIQRARLSGATIVHALAGSAANVDLRNPIYRSVFWQQSTKDRRLGRKLVQRATSLVRNKAATSPPPLDLLFGPSTRYCSELGRSDSRLHQNVSADFSKDIMFDNGFFFHRLARAGITRLFYVGSALNQCVLFTRMFSAMEAVFTQKFREVGIVLDLTLSIERVSGQPGCEGVSSYECASRFSHWLNRNLNFTTLTFWDYGK